LCNPSPLLDLPVCLFEKAFIHDKADTIVASITDTTTFSLLHKYTALFPPPESTTTVLNMFADPSSKAYTAASYIQQNYHDALLVMSKYKAAPLKKIMLPKL